ncbi:MAG: hypothetical protein KDD02_05675 [Phaeodactylibacter sp.]|nr:hypothetical protein [Phaeodactylibacter sp.]MCB9299935.1 DNA primase [Lewinellaceae bacterium]
MKNRELTPNERNGANSHVPFDFSPFKQSRQAVEGITPEDFLKEVQAIQKRFGPLPHSDVLKALLDKVKRIDFREQAGLQDEKESLKKKHYLVTAIEELLTLARINNWGLCKKYDFIYLYNGAFWSLLSDDELTGFLGDAGEKMGIDKFDCRHYLFKDQLYKQFLSAAHLPEPLRPDNRVLINLKNGTFEVTPDGGKICNFNRNDFITYQLPFEYNPSAKAPMFEAYLDRVLPDKECQYILAEYLGYIFTRHLKLEKTLLLYGTGANGKSVFFEVVNALLGKENVTSYSLQSLTNETGYYRAKLANALLNYASEINGRLETSIFKQLVSGEPVEARLPYGDPFTLTQYARLIFNCNELPKEVEHTIAFFRRFLIIPFRETIPEHEQDKELANKIIKNELSGVFNWVLEGLARLLSQKGFSRSEAVEEQLMEYRKQSDSVQLFLEEEGYEKHEYETDVSALKMSFFYGEYKAFCIDNNYHAVSKINFKKRLSNIGFYIPPRTKMGYVVYARKEQ